MREIVAKRYAKALIEIGKEDGNYERYGDELKAFSQVLSAVPELKEVMINPIFNMEQKRAIFKGLQGKLALSPIVTNFIMLLIDKRRVGDLEDIVRCYEEFADEVSGRVRAEVLSAVPLPPQGAEAIKERLSRMTQKEVVLSLQEDPSLIGGVVTKIGDMVYDGSIRTQLHSIKETLLKG